MTYAYYVLGVVAFLYFGWCVRAGRAMREQTVAKLIQAFLAAMGALILLALGLWPDEVVRNREVLHHLRFIAHLRLHPVLSRTALRSQVSVGGAALSFRLPR